MKCFTPANKDLFFSKKDQRDPRLGDLVLQGRWDEDLSAGLSLLGYPDDEGIEINGGRKGAALAPTQIRRYFYRMTPGFATDIQNLNLRDFGDLHIDPPLGQRHEQARSAVAALLNKNQKLLTFGGGHDYAYPDGAGFLNRFIHEEAKPLIINFDAHLDVRPTDHGISSGTPFFRLLEEFSESFDFVEVGIQEQCNSPHHIQWCKDRDVKILSLESIRRSSGNLKDEFCEIMSGHMFRRPVFLSIDIDGFSSNFAPGCSQSWPTGLEPTEVMELLDHIYDSFDVKIMGIYEVSPPLDFDDHTAKLAALLAFQWLKKSKE